MTTSSRPNWTLALGLPLLVIASCAAIVFSPLFALNPTRFSTAITLDLTLTAPLLYFIAIRKTTVSKMTVIRVFVAGVLVAGLLLSQRSPLLRSIKTWISPLVEALVIFMVFRKVYQSRRDSSGQHQSDFLSRARIAASNAIGSERIGHIMASEFAVFYYVFIAKKAKDGFSYARASGAIPVLGVFMLCMLAEGIGLHFLIAHWSAATAWVLTTLSAYTMLQLYAHMRAMKARPIRVEGGMLYLRNGLAADVTIKFADIEEIQLTTRTVRGEVALKLALLGALEGHTMRIRLRQPVTVVRMFDIRRQASVLLFAVDRPEELRAKIAMK
jgi:hypothetical protein